MGLINRMNINRWFGGDADARLTVEEYNKPLPICAIVLTGIAGIMMTSLKPLLITAYVQYLNFSDSMAGYLLAVEMLSAAIGTIGTASIVHAWNRRLLAFAGLILIFSGNLLSCVITAYDSLVVVRFVAGLGAGIAVTVMAGGTAGVKNPDRIFGIYTVITLCLGALFMTLAGQLLSIIGIKGAFLILTLMSLPALALFVKFPAFGPVCKQDTTATAFHWRDLPLRKISIVMSAVILYYIAAGGVWPYMGQIGKACGLSTEDAINLIALSGLFGAAGALVPFLMGTRYGRAWPLAVSMILSAICLAALLYDSNSIIFAVVVQAYMFMWLMFFPYIMGVVSEIDPFGRLNGLCYTIQSVGFTVGPILTGLLVAEGSNYSNLYYLGILSYVLSIFFLIPVVIRQDLKRRKAVPVAATL